LAVNIKFLTKKLKYVTYHMHTPPVEILVGLALIYLIDGDRKSD